MRPLPRTRAASAATAAHRSALSAASMRAPEVSRRLLLSLCSALLAAPAPDAATAAAAGAATLKVFDVASSELDRRSFRGLQLPNGLRVLLCSDPDAARAAASMNVAAGSMNNPVEWPGLAHFCEHMLFLGTKKYPTEGEFERFISSNGGSNNAFTGGEETNYFFDVGGEALPGALARFSDFFAAPLFSESGVAREVDAIDSEHSKNLQSDFWRADAVLKLRARPDRAPLGSSLTPPFRSSVTPLSVLHSRSHPNPPLPGSRADPYSRFYTGNRETLRGGDADARAALRQFYEAYYRAPQMQLAVVGPQKLDALQKLVASNFNSLQPGPAPLASLAYDALPPPFEVSPAPPPTAILLVPVKEQRSVTLTWNLPVSDVDAWLRCKPESIFTGLLSNRAKGSLSSYLKAQGLASAVDGSVDEYTRTFIVLSAYVSLTPQGLERWREVVAAVFAYLRLLREEGVPPHVFAEERRMRELGFTYAEPAAPQSFVQTSGNLALYPPQEWLRGPVLAEAGAEPYVQQILRGCTPQAAIVKLTAKEFASQATNVEKIYGAKYGEIPIAKAVAAWADPPRLPGVSAPQPNRFIPTELTLKGASGAPFLGRVKPQLLLNEPAARLHFLQDATFGRPKAFAYVSLRSPQLYETPAIALQADLYQNLLADALQDVAYEAARAGLSAGAGVGWQGLSLSLSGYDQNLPELAALVGDSLRTFDIPPRAFERQRDGLRRKLLSFNTGQPVAQCSYRRATYPPPPPTYPPVPPSP